MTPNKQKEKDMSEIIGAVDAETLRHYTIINYLLNKNSKSTSEGGVDYKQFFDDMQDYEDYLREQI